MITASNEDLRRSGMPGGFLSLSWDGVNDSSAILWGLFPPLANGNRQSVAGELAAFDASTFDLQSNFNQFNFNQFNMADGLTFTVQAAGPHALGSCGSGLGYAIDPSDQTNTEAQILHSIALAFNIVNNTLSLCRDGKIGDPPVVQITDLRTHNIALNRGNLIRVNVAYDNALKVLTVTVKDLTTGASTGPLAIPNIDIPGFLNLGVPALAHIGFTGGTGAKVQNRSYWIGVSQSITLMNAQASIVRHVMHADRLCQADDF